MNLPAGTTFESIYHSHYQALCFYAEGITGHTQSAEDMVTETFIKLLRGNNSFDTLSQVKSFLYTITRNACIDLLRKEKRQQVVMPLPPEEDSSVIEAEVLQAIYAAMAALPPQVKKIMELSFIEGKKLDEIALELNIAYHTVQNQKSKGVKLLRLALLENKLLSPPLLAACLFFLSENLWDKIAVPSL